MRSKKVSVIMPAYNAEKTIKTSIDSVLAQTFKDWELIVIDDASHDGTNLKIPKDPRVTVLVNTSNAGAALSRNYGIKHAKGEWLAFLDSDDLWREDKLEKQLKFMEETGAVISYTATAYMDDTGENRSYILKAKRCLSYQELLRQNLMSCSSVVVRWDEMRDFPEGYLHEDYVVWLKILRSVGVAYGLNEPLLVYRIAKGSKSDNRVSSAKMIYNAYRRVDYGVCMSSLLTFRYAFHSIEKRWRILKS